MLQLNLSDDQFYCLLRCNLYWRFDGIWTSYKNDLRYCHFITTKLLIMCLFAAYSSSCHQLSHTIDYVLLFIIIIIIIIVTMDTINFGLLLITSYNCRDIFLCMCQANDRWCYNVTSSLIGWAHSQIDPCSCNHCRQLCIPLSAALLPCQCTIKPLI